MASKQDSNVDTWLERETKHNREALENASRYFDGNDNLTVNTLEAIYGQESSFGLRSKMGERGSSDAAGHFQFRPLAAKRYGLIITKNNDQRFDIDYASSAAARYLKDLNGIFVKRTILSKDARTIPIKNISEREKFILAAYNGGERRIARAQYFAEQARKNPQIWDDVRRFLVKAGATEDKAKEISGYVDNILAYEEEFAEKSPANKKFKDKEGKGPEISCTQGHWVTIDDRPVFICG